MQEQPASLSDLRREVDSVDDAVHDLLMRRAALSDQIAQHPDRLSEEGTVVSRPARKAELLRRLVARHSGSFPMRSLVRVWCEILATTSVQKGAMHVYAGDGAALYRDVARTYFGSLMPMTSHASATAVLHACSDTPSAMGVVPLVDSGEEGANWWTHLAPAGHPGPRIAAILPFISRDGGEEPFPQAFAIGSVEQEATGNDTTLLLLESDGDLSRTRLQSFLQQAGFDAHLLAAAGGGGQGASQLLLANRGFVGAEDPRLAAFVAKAGDANVRLAPVGGYANPLDDNPESTK